jgi:hypothetical protein
VEEEGGAELLVLAGPEEELVVAPVMDMLLSTRDTLTEDERKETIHAHTINHTL